MTPPLKRFSRQLPAFILLGIGIALTIGLFIVFMHVVLWGILLGGILWACSYIKQYIISARNFNKKKGRIINHDQEK